MHVSASISARSGISGINNTSTCRKHTTIDLNMSKLAGPQLMRQICQRCDLAS